MPKRLNSFEKKLWEEQRDAAKDAVRELLGISATCTTSNTSASEDRTASKTVSGCVPTATGLLTEREVSRLYVIKREVGRKYVVTMQDLQFLIEVIERCGL